MHETWLWKCLDFFSAIILLHDITAIYYICEHYILLGYSKTQGWHTALFSSSGRVLGTYFAALVYLVFKYLKHLASVDIKWESSLAIQHTQLNHHLDE